MKEEMNTSNKRVKVRIKFRKYGSTKFIGHLDVMRCFQKNFRRAGLDVSYSQGFSPHQLMSFSAPLGVGITSDGEYLDLTMNSITDRADMMKRINETSVCGIDVTDIIVLKDGAVNSMSAVRAADYIVTIRQEGYEELDDRPTLQEFYDKFEEFMQQKSIIVTKKTKKSEAQVDIRPLIYEYSFAPDTSSEAICTYDNSIALYMLVSTGSVDNLSPKLVMDAFCAYAGYEFDEYAFQFHRVDIYSRNDEDKLIPLSEVDINSEQTDFYTE